MNPKIAIAVSTYMRSTALFPCLRNVVEYFPDGAEFFIIDGGSPDDYNNGGFDIDYKFDHRATISEVKNKCLQLCYDSGADHIFLFDDDTWPIHNDWWKTYINSGEHHLCYTFLPKHKSFSKTITRNLSKGTIRCYSQWQQELKSHLLGNGCMLYFTRHCIKTVGGFDTNYVNKYEHCDLSRRVYNARLTNHIYQDIANSSELIYCLDQDNKIQRSFTNREMQDNLKLGYEYFRSREGSSEFIEFRT